MQDFYKQQNEKIHQYMNLFRCTKTILRKIVTLCSPLFIIFLFISFYGNAQDGLTGVKYEGYYADNLAFFDTATTQADARFDNVIFTAINTTTPGQNFDDTYSVRFYGYFTATETGTHTFYTASDDASMLWIGNANETVSALETRLTTSNAIVSNPGPHGVTERSGTVSLVNGNSYPILVYFGENGGGDSITVSFAAAGIAKTSDGSSHYSADAIVFGLNKNGKIITTSVDFVNKNGGVGTNSRSSINGESIVTPLQNSLRIDAASSQYLTFTKPSSLNATGDFTFETWINFNTIQAGTMNPIFGGGQSDYISLYSGWLMMRINVNNPCTADRALFNNSNLTTGTWHHIAVVRSGSTITAYLDGVATGNTTSCTGTFMNSLSTVYIGKNTWRPGYLNAFISNMRYVVGTAVYTANFTPPKSVLTAISGTQFLFLANDVSFPLKDSGPNNITVNSFGGPTLTIGNGPF